MDAKPLPDPRLSAVGIEVYPLTYNLLFEICDRIRDEHGSEIHLYVRNQIEKRHFDRLNADGRWASVTVSNVMPEALRAADLDRDEVVARASELEAQIGTTLTQVAFSERLFISGHSPGQFYPRNDKVLRKISNTQFLHAVSESVGFWMREIERRGLTLILQADKAAACAARAKGVLFRVFDAARFENRWMWQTNEYYFSGAVEAHYRELSDSAELSITEPYGHAVSKDAITSRRQRLPTVLRRMALAAVNHTKFRLRGNPKAKTMPFFDFVTGPLRGYFDYRRMRGTDTVRLSELEGSTFAYFPLHKEPETGLQLLSPEACNQQNVIMSVARELPAGVLLALKENINSLGRRQRTFYDQLMRLKNVVFLNIEEPGLAVAKEAALTVSITGTAGFEAAAMGKPVISYGQHNMYNVMPHVMVVRQESDVGPFIERALSGDFDQAQAAADGQRFLNAVVRASFDMKGYSIGRKNRFANIDPEAVEAAYRGLVDSLDVKDVNTIQAPAA